jgi:hypothetical protein
LATSLPDRTGCRLGGRHQADKPLQPGSGAVKKPPHPTNTINISLAIHGIADDLR